MPRIGRRGRVALLVLACVILFFILLGWVVGIWTDWLWFSQVHYTRVFSTILWNRIGLFAVFGAVVGLIVWFNMWLAFRLRPLLRPSSAEQHALDRYRSVLGPHFGRWAGILAAVVGFFTGLSAQGHWRQWLLFTNAQPFGVDDPQFGVDIGFYVFRYPFWRYLMGVGFTTVVVCLISALLVHYVFGGVRLQGRGDRMTTATRAHLTAIVAAFVLLKAVAYFLDQRGLVLAHNGGTGLYGAGYTGVNALLTAKQILTWISVVVAVAILVFSNAFIRNLVWPGIAIGLLALSAIAVGGIYPAVVQTFTVKPNIRDKEATYIARSIAATRAAFGLSTVTTTDYPASTLAPPPDIGQDSGTVANVRLLDPSIVSDTYTQLQQVRGFYDFTQKLDVDRYVIDGQPRDYVVGVRELDYGSLTGQQGNWQNEHTVYTHGYGFVGAPANKIVCGGQPAFASGFLDSTNPDEVACQSPTDQIPVANPRIYYGEGMDPYAIVGKAPGGKDAEYDRPKGDNDQQYVTYDGSGGVPVGSTWRRVLYAYKFKEINFLISSVFNGNSKILYERDPRKRVQKVAPFLTLDGDPYPAVVDGRIMWIIDGYTTAATYPYSQQVDLKAATNDSLTGAGAAPQTQHNINYLRNSVKATVDAYTGTVTLYAFDNTDPVLKAWNQAFGGHIVRPASEIPPDLAAHFRYPEDQFKVQRELLTQFHVTDPRQFYSSQDAWEVPQDPAPHAKARQAPYYLLARFPGQQSSTFQLTAAMTPRGRQNLAALISGFYVDGKPRLQILQLPDDTQVSGPGQADQKMTNDQEVRSNITLSTTADVLFGNLLSLPVAGGMLYVEPLYLKSKGENTYPQLKYVLVNFGQYIGYGDTLQAALSRMRKAVAANPPPSGPSPDPSSPGTSTSPTPSPTPPPPSPSPTPNSPPTNSPPVTTPAPGGGTGVDPAVAAAAERIQQAIDDLRAAQKSGDFDAYGQALQELNDAIDAYEKARAAASPNPSGAPPPAE